MASASSRAGERGTMGNRPPPRAADLEWPVPRAFWGFHKHLGVGEGLSAFLEGGQERRGCHLGKTAYGSCLSEAAFQSRYSVTFCPSTPTLFATCLKMFLRGSELLTNLWKMLWKTLSTKTDRPVPLAQIRGHWPVLFKAEREGGGKKPASAK